MGRVLLAVVILVVLVAVMVQWVLPTVVEKGTEAALAKLSGGEVELSLEAYPTARMLLGKFDVVTVEARNVRAASLIIDKVRTSIQGLSVNMRDLLLNREITIEESGPVETEITIGEANLIDYLWRGVDGIRDGAIILRKDKAVLTGYVTFQNRTFRIEASGRFVPVGRDKVGFEIDDLRVDDIPLPADFREKVLDMIGAPEMFMDLSRLPMPMEVKAVEMRDGELVITGVSAGE